VLAALLLIAAGFAAFRIVLSRRVVWERIGPAPAEEPMVTRPVTLFFGAPDGDGVLPERRQAPVRDDPAETMRAVVLALIAGPQGDLTPTLPAGTDVLDVFLGADGTLYINFTADLVDRHPGGSSGEYATLASIVRTMTANFPEVKAVQILVDGRARESLAGHFSIREALRPEEFMP
jgi:spore germination protein GerM